MDQQITREILSITHSNITKSDKVLGARFNQVAMKALNRAEIYLEHGPESARLAVTKSFLTAISRLSAADNEEALTVHREAFMRTLSQMTNVTPHMPDDTAKAITVGTNDQDDE